MGFRRPTVDDAVQIAKRYLFASRTGRAGLAPADRADMLKHGKVVVTCEFCSSVYQFTPQEAGVE